MPNDGNGLRRTDGQFSWLGGVNSDLPRTKRIPGVLDDGLAQNQASWMINCSVRGGGIGQRPVLQPLVQGIPWSGRFQGKFLYQPDYGMPIMIVAVGGRIYRVRVDTDNSVVDLTAAYSAPVLPVDAEHFFFAQAEMFLVIQVGDYVTNPLFYDFGAEGIRPETLRQSNGFIGVANAGNEIPPAGPMKYYAQRLWYAFARGYAAGDIAVNKTSGTAAYDYRDSVLKVTENIVAYSGDSFLIPISAGDIRALDFAANIDSQLGEAQLYVFTRKAVFTCLAPVTRTAWVATTLDAQPLQKVALDKGGTYSDRSVVKVNGDLFFQSPPNGDIRSLQTATKEWGNWGSVPLSNNVNRALVFNDRALLRHASGILYDNILLETTLPVNIPSIGIGHQGVIALDFDTISTLGERHPPSWQGLFDVSGGPYIMQMTDGDFGGRERAFAVVWSLARLALEIWEIRNDLRFENGENRVQRVIEFPAYAFGDPLELKKLDSGELWFDKMLGAVDYTVEFRPDSYGCWQPWHKGKLCAAKNCVEDQNDPCPDTGYPLDPYCEQDAIPVVLPHPPSPICITQNSRPSDWGYQFQMKLTIKGWARLRGVVMYALAKDRPPYQGLACPVISDDNANLFAGIGAAS